MDSFFLVSLMSCIEVRGKQTHNVRAHQSLSKLCSLSPNCKKEMDEEMDDFMS